MFPKFDFMVCYKFYSTLYGSIQAMAKKEIHANSNYKQQRSKIYRHVSTKNVKQINSPFVG